MLYGAHYERLIARARARVLDGYRERHHVVPRCMGGDNSSQNLVYLTGEEHYVAHQLLVKMYPSVGGLATAVVFMAKQSTGNKAYGWLRRRFAKAKSAERRGKKSPNFGNKFSADARARMSAAFRGRKMPPFSPEHRAKISEALRRRVVSQATRLKMSVARRGKKCSQETRAKIAAAELGKKCAPHSLETRAKMSAAQLARYSRQRNEQIVNFH